MRHYVSTLQQIAVYSRGEHPLGPLGLDCLCVSLGWFDLRAGVEGVVEILKNKYECLKYRDSNCSIERERFDDGSFCDLRAVTISF